MTTELATINITNPLQIFSTPKGLDDVIDKIEKEVKSIDRDISTHAGRENIRSIAFKLAKTKNALDKMGKELTEEQRKVVDAVNAERKRAWDRMEALQHEIRQPLTDWENAEKDRVAGHELVLAEIAAAGTHAADSITFAAALLELDKYRDRDWQEFAERGKHALANKTTELTQKRDAALKAEADARELERLRKEEEARKRKEEDARIAHEAAEKARLAAEAKASEDARIAQEKAEREKRDAEERAAAEKARAEKAEAEASAAAAKAEADRIAAEAKAEQEKAAAVEAERKRIEAEAKAKLDAEAKETAKREADKKHMAKINNEVKTAILKVAAILDADERAQAIVVAIAKGQIPHVKITY
jgi:hypothetical protein